MILKFCLVNCFTDRYVHVLIYVQAFSVLGHTRRLVNVTVDEHEMYIIDATDNFEKEGTTPHHLHTLDLPKCSGGKSGRFKYIYTGVYEGCALRLSTYIMETHII